MRRRLVRTILLSLLIAFLIGAAVGIYRQLWLGDLDSLETATFAYGFAGRLISFPIAWIMDLVALDTAAQWLQDYVLYYLEIPYQLCAFAGACTATAAIGLVDQIIPGLGSHH
jgi:hypothetical protein